MIDKGKGLVVRKLRIIQLIEADLQLVMRIIFNQNKHSIERNKRVLKNNFRSRLDYSIKLVILHKRLVYDNNKFTNKVIVHNMIDLEVCYDRQLAPIRSIV